MSWANVALVASSAITAGGGYLSSKEAGKSAKNAKPLAPMIDKEPFQLESGQAVADWAKKYMPGYVPGAEFGGKRTAGMSPQETQGMEWLQKYMNQPNTGENYNLAAGEIKKTLTGGYNPATSDFYQATRQGAMREQESAIDALRRSQGYRGTFFQDTGVREEGKVREGTANYLQQLLGSMGEKERQNRLAAVPQAMNLEQYAQGAPLAKAAAGMSLGSLPRLIEQGDLEARYQDFLRKQTELGGTIPAAQGVFGTSVNYAVEQPASSPFDRIMGLATMGGNLLSQFMGNKGTAGTPTSAGGGSNFASAGDSNAANRLLNYGG